MATRILIVLVGCVLLVGLFGCQKTPSPSLTTTASETALPLSTSSGATEAFLLSSPAFTRGQAIPALYTCDGADSSPALSWADPPAGTQSFALVVSDPDAPVGTWVHWVVYNIPADARRLPEAIMDDAGLPGGVHGKNSWGRFDYGGPCPPSGTHRYFFKLYALDALLAPAGDATQKQVLAAMKGHILAETELMGVYKRQ